MLTKEEYNLIDIVYNDLLHIKQEANPYCDDNQLRRISVQLRSLLIEDQLIKAWKLLSLEPKQPIIVAPRLYTKYCDEKSLALAGGANITNCYISNVKYIPGKALSPEEIKEMYEIEKAGYAYDFKLSEYKESASIYINGITTKRRNIIAYVAHKKGGAHLDTSRKKDEEIYENLDSAFNSLLSLGGNISPNGGITHKGKNPIYAELMSIAQSVLNSPDIIRFIEICRSEYKCE